MSCGVSRKEARSPIHRYLFPEDSLDLVPTLDQRLLMLRRREIDYVPAIPWIQFALFLRGQQVVDAPFNGRVIAATASERLGFRASQRTTAIRAAQQLFKTFRRVLGIPRRPLFTAHGRKRASEQPSSRPHRAVPVHPNGQAFHDRFAPAALRHENLVSVIGKVGFN